MARKKKKDQDSWNRSLGYSDKALKALSSGTYDQLTGRDPEYNTSKEQTQQSKSLPVLKGTSTPEWKSSFSTRNYVDTDRARQKYASRIGYTPLGQVDTTKTPNDENYVVKRDRYDKLMKDGRLANDIKTLATITYNNANQSADVREEWANEWGAKKITGGYNKEQFIDMLSRRYDLTPKELNDMALTFHSDAYKKETEQYGKDLEKLGKERSVLGSLGSFVGTLGSGIEGGYNAIVGGITGDNRYLSNIFRTTKNAPREGVKKNIKSDLGKGAYDIGMGIGDMAVGAAAGSAPAILAGNAANEAQASALDRGSSVRKASVYGAGAGALDFITNKIGLDKAKKLAVDSIKSTGIKKFLAQNAIAGAGEAGENIIQDIGQSLIDELVNGQNSELRTSYNDKIASGMNESDAFKEVAKEYASQIALSAGIGFGMGSAMQGGSTILPKVPKLVADKWAEAKMSPVGAVDPNIRDILDGAMESPIENAKAQQAEAVDNIDKLAKKIPALTQDQEATSAPKYTDPVDKAMAESDFTKTHTPEEIASAQAYVNSTDPQLLQVIERAKAGDKVSYNLKNVSSRAAKDIYDLTNLETEGNEVIINNEVINNHIDRRHGANGEADKTMADPATLARAQYILDNYDEAFRSRESSITHTKENLNAPVVAFVKKLDGKYAVFEAVSDGAKRKNYIVDAYFMNGEGLKNSIEKGSFTRASDAPDDSVPTHDGLTEHDTSFDLNVTPEGENVNKYMKESAGLNNPKYVQKLEGNDLTDAQNTVKKNSQTIKALKNEIKLLEDDPKSKRNGKIIKNVQDDIDARKQQIKDLQSENKALNRQIKGEPTPVKEQLTKEQYNAIYGKYDSINSDIFVAQKLAGDTPEANQLAANAKAALGRYIESGDKADLKDFLQNVSELDVLARDSGGEYVTKNNRYSYDDWYGRDVNSMGDEYSVGLTGSVLNRNGLQAIDEFHKARNSAPIEEPAPVIPDNAEPLDIPTTENNGMSRVVTHSAINADIISQKMLDSDPVLQDIAKYAKHSNEQTFNSAMDNVKKNGTGLLDEYISEKRKIDNDLDVDQSMIILQNLSQQIRDMGADAPEQLVNQRNLLLSRLRAAGTKYGQTIQAFAKWNNTPEGAIMNGEAILSNAKDKWKGQNKQKVAANSRIAKALEQMGVDSSMRNQPAKAELTHDQIKEGVIKVLDKEFGSVENYFNDNDIEFLTILAENKVPIWQITDEIEHKMNFGDWYSLDESIEPKMPTNQKLQNALNGLIEREPAPEKEPLTLNEIKDQVRNTLAKESASLGEDFTDDDIDYVASLIQNGATRAELTEALNTKLATGKFAISADTQQKVNELFEYASHYDPNSKEAFEAKSAAYKLIADEVVGDASPFEKFESWRYLAMLGNPKTMFRNWIGNQLFNAVTGVSNNLSAAMEEGVDWAVKKAGGEGIQRTKAVLNPAKDKGLIKAAGIDLDSHRYAQAQGGKYEKSIQDSIRGQKSVFNSKWAQLYEKLTDKGISDYSAVKRKYATSLAGYMKANGLDEKAFDAESYYRNLQKESQYRLLTDAEKAQMEDYKQTMDAVEKARDFAFKQAEYATFHEDNAVAKWLSKMSGEDAPFLGRAFIEGLVPFKKTPANVLRSGVEFSPLNAIKSIKETGKLIYENTGARKGNLEDTYTKKSWLTGKDKEVNKTLASDVIDSWAKTLTGSGLMALGYYLFDKGVLNSSNEGEKYQDELEGKQNYSITINGKTYTIDWATPAVMPLLMGAEMSKLSERLGKSDESFFNNVDEIFGAVGSLLDPVLETSMLQGVQNTAESVARGITYGNNALSKGLNVFGALLGTPLTSYATQALPTMSGQIARTVDPTRRATDTAHEGLVGDVEKQGRKLMNKIPGLSQFNNPYYDAYGRTQNNSPSNNPLLNLLYQSVSPAYVQDINTTRADESARGAFNGLDSNGNPIKDENVFAAWKNSVKVNGEKLNPDQMAEYRQTTGKANYDIRTALAKEPWFNELDAARQTEILKKVNTLVDKVGKEKYTDVTGKDYEAYKKGGIPSLLDYYNESSAKKEITEKTGLNAQSNAAKTIKADLDAGNVEAAEEKISDAERLTSLGFTKPGPIDTFYKAQSIVPSISPDDFARTYKDIDADGNEGIKQDEVLGYLNRGNYTESEAMQIWSMYAPKGKKVPYLKKDGTWGKH